MSALERTCLVTGGAGEGIGSGITRALAADGWRVVIADKDEDSAVALVEELSREGYAVTQVRTDVADPASLDAAVEYAAASGGSLTGLVNSAGVGAIGRAADVDEDVFDRIFSVDLRSAWRLLKLVLPHMQAADGGSIVNIGSVHAYASHPGWAVYAAAKAALEALSRGIAADYGRDGIRCNIVHPGLVDSRQNRQGFAAFGDPEEYMTEFLQRSQMLPIAIQPIDVGRAVAFLLGDNSRAITGVSLTVDAGSAGLLFDNHPNILRYIDGLAE